MLEDSGPVPKEEGDMIREYKAMHGENFLSSCLREDVEGVKAEMERADREANSLVSLEDL